MDNKVLTSKIVCAVERHTELMVLTMGLKNGEDINVDRIQILIDEMFKDEISLLGEVAEYNLERKMMDDLEAILENVDIKE